MHSQDHSVAYLLQRLPCQFETHTASWEHWISCLGHMDEAPLVLEEAAQFSLRLVLCAGKMASTRKVAECIRVCVCSMVCRSHRCSRCRRTLRRPACGPHRAASCRPGPTSRQSWRSTNSPSTLAGRCATLPPTPFLLFFCSSCFLLLLAFDPGHGLISA